MFSWLKETFREIQVLSDLQAVRMAIPGLSGLLPIASRKEKLTRKASARSIRKSRPLKLMLSTFESRVGFGLVAESRRKTDGATFSPE